MRVPNELINSVCYVCTKLQGKMQYGCTAFFVGCPAEGGEFEHLYAVTARHCLKGIRELGGDVYLRINTMDGRSKNLQIQGEWIYPDSEAVDLAVYSTHFPSDSGIQIDPISIYDLVVDEPRFSHIIGPGQELLITGLFTLRRGTLRNYPIVRAGILAAMPDEKLADENGEFDAYLAEVRSIGGLSGSPVFSIHRPNISRYRVNPTSITYGDQQQENPRVLALSREEDRRYFLLGLIRGHWDLERGLMPAFADELGQVNMGIAIVTPASEIWKILNGDRLKEERKALEKEYRANNL